MHLAAAVDSPPDAPRHRPCVVVAGGREPPHFTAHPHHQFIHTVGALRCCDDGGCWKSRAVPLGDGAEKDRPEALCVDVVGLGARIPTMSSVTMICTKMLSEHFRRLFSVRRQKFLSQRQVIAQIPPRFRTGPCPLPLPARLAFC
jgi:hypothetical protein